MCGSNKPEEYGTIGVIYCGNPLCEWEATHVLDRSDNESHYPTTPLPLCAQCAQAVITGQMWHDEPLYTIEYWAMEEVRSEDNAIREESRS